MKKVVGTPFKNGNTGRKKGSQNKLTKTVKETVLSVFNKLQDDPKNNLTKFAEKYPRDFYNIAAKLIPTELTGAIDNHITLQIVRGKSNSK
jgi:hypothetical protein